MFQLNITKKATFDGKVEKQVTAKNGIEMTICIKKDVQFESAFADVSALLNKTQTITRDSLKRTNQGGVHSNEAMLFLIGEYCISDWNIEVDGEKFAINGENLFTVLENAFDGESLPLFVVDLLNAFTDGLHEYKNKVGEIKKKALEQYRWQRQKQELTPKRLEIYRRQGIQPPSEVPSDYHSDMLIHIFVLASRARRYVDGVALPLTVRDVSDVLAAYPCHLPRFIIDEAVFAMDGEWLQPIDAPLA